ncbi:MAG: MOSC domain-containing protein [Chloroflexota bacterium]|nr:MOSC domain-containing protein [Chloroflexota bacterium]
MADRRPGRVVSVNVNDGGVPKLPVAEQWVGLVGLADDRHNEPEPIHGGVDQAVCLYAMEAIERVVADGHTAFPGAFGENLTLEGIEMDSLVEGDRLAIGADGLVIEMTWPAAPCKTQAHWFIDGRFARISHKTHPNDSRWYARVISEGPVRPGDAVR